MYICDKTIENNNIINTKVYMLNSKSARVNQYYKQPSIQKVHHLNNPMNKGSNKLEIDLPLKVAMEMYCKIEIPSIHIK